jgi:predicted PurR-regulated permease PerM
MTGMQIFRATLIVMGTIALALLFGATIQVWLVLWIAILIASALRPPIMRLVKWGLPQAAAIPVVYGFVLISAFVLIMLVLPPVINQFTRYLENEDLLVNKIIIVQNWFARTLSDITGEEFTSSSDANAAQTDEVAPGIDSELVDPDSSEPEEVVISNGREQTVGFTREQIREGVSDLIRQFEVTAPSLIGSLGGFIGDFVLVFVMGIYWITSRTRAEEFLIDLLPIGRQAQARAIMDEIEIGLGGYVRGIILVSVFVGLLSFGAMLLVNALPLNVNIPNAATLAFFYGLATAVPIIGGLIGVVVATALAFLTATPAAGFAVFAITVLLQQVENYYISPRIMASSSSFDEILVIVFIAAGFTIDGIRGGLIAIPVAATAAILLKHLLIIPRKDKVLPTRIEGGIMLTVPEDARPLTLEQK